MNVVDLFSGTGGWSQAFLDRGHAVLRFDNDPKFANVPHTHMRDIKDFNQRTVQHYGVDVILASPPCQKFSVARIGYNWHGDKNTPLTPKTHGAREAMELVETTLYVIAVANPKFWWMENPTGAMRRLAILDGLHRRQTTFCQYGKPYRKPTDLWGKWPDGYEPRMACTGHPKNGTTVIPDSIGGKVFVLDHEGRPCHESAPRGAKTGVQGLKDATERGKIPYELSLEVCLAAEAAI